MNDSNPKLGIIIFVLTTALMATLYELRKIDTKTAEQPQMAMQQENQ